MNLSAETRLALEKMGAEGAALDKLARYVAMIAQWNKAINLVSPATIPLLWERHILDSAQLFPLIVQSGLASRLIDLGAGGGLPGLVLAMMGAEHVTLIESDARKCVFMREVSRETKLENVTIINERIENITELRSSIVIARALAPLRQLIAWAEQFLEADGQAFFMKGKDVSRETSALDTKIAQKISLIPSRTETGSFIIGYSRFR